MIRPVQFRLNEQTAVNNYFQAESHLDPDTLNRKAQREFDGLVQALRNRGIDVIVISDSENSDTPDSIFPNNWVSFHADGTVVVYPMFAENRRKERREDVFTELEAKGFHISQILDYTSAERDNKFLEGTGSLVMDRVHKKVYCALSDRASEELVMEFCEEFNCLPLIFTACQTVEGARLPIYHTNVMMCLGENLAVVCLESIDDKKERKAVEQSLRSDGLEIIPISEDQMHQFAGNMIQLKGKGDQRFMVMSSAAYHSLLPQQLEAITKHCEIIHSKLDTIEQSGGGSARCMIAEVFLPKSPLSPQTDLS